MKLLFLGGTGIISTACTELATRSGFDLFLLNRGTRPAALPANVKVLTADIHDPAQTAAALRPYFRRSRAIHRLQAC